MSPSAKNRSDRGGGTLPLVLHVDMDAFFASVEIRSDPRLAGKAMVVGGGPGGRGVVTTASYPARRFGIASGMSLAEARRLCPELLVVPVNPRKMIHESLAVLAVLDGFSSRVEPASIDEAYVDGGAVEPARWETEARWLAAAIQSAMRERRGITCSVGAAPNKLQAKMASGLRKPEGITVVAPGTFGERFGAMPVGTIPGVGPKSVAALLEAGIRTIAELAAAEPRSLKARFGVWGEGLLASARGDGSRTVVAAGEESDPKSAGHETTFAEDVSDPAELRATLLLLADRVARRLRRGGFRARVVVVRYKVGRARHSRQVALREPTDRPDLLARIGWRLLERERGGRALRLLGIAGAHLVAAGSEWLFAEECRVDSAQRTGDRLRDRFGEDVLLPAGVLLGRPDAQGHARRRAGGGLGLRAPRRDGRPS